MGVQLAVDDFGTGFSSLTFLTRIAVDELKVDRSFVMRMADSPEAAAIVRTTVDLGRELGLRVVAEGVETADQRAALAELGCTAAQGYHFFQPMPADKIVAVLRSLLDWPRPDLPAAGRRRVLTRRLRRRRAVAAEAVSGRAWPTGSVDATCPYLLQHADNPVDWWPWSREAFAEARRRDVPVLISVGYAACHWCHVMAHESFEDESVAALVNDHFVPIKVDREERPDVDAVYMTATQAMTGQGGWPMTVFATPDGNPFFCGTYFPQANFVRLVQSVTKAWRDQRDAVLRQGAAVVEAIGGAQAVGGPTAPLDRRPARRRGRPARQEYDATQRRLRRRAEVPAAHGPALPAAAPPAHRLADASLEIVRHTAEAMARGGIYDQLAGGFARYSVDAHWTVPHFEKMLYDNALLLRVYTQLWRLTGDPLARRVAGETAAFLLATWHRRTGGFASALDADTDGVEGLTYAWTPAQLVEALGEEDGRWAADLFDVTDEGTFEHGTQRAASWPATSTTPHPSAASAGSGVRDRLLAARAARPQPARDDKVVAAWNGLAITALVEYAAARPATRSTVGRAPRPSCADGAGRPAPRRRPAAPGLPRRRGRRAGRGAGGLRLRGRGVLRLHQLTGEGRWLELAGELLDTALAHFGAGDGGFYDTADDAEQLVTRPADPTDNATPSGLSALIARRWSRTRR